MKKKVIVVALTIMLMMTSFTSTSYAKNAEVKANSVEDLSFLDEIDERLVKELEKEAKDMLLNGQTEAEVNVFVVSRLKKHAMKKWSRSMLDSSNVPYDKGILNSEEKKIFNSNPVKGLSAVSTAYDAKRLSEKLFQSQTLYQGNGDAYRHSFWQASLANAEGKAYAKRWGDAHEIDSTGIDKTMDLRNNEIGRNVGSSITGYQAVDGRISHELLKRISEGKLWRIQNNKLIHTDGSGRK